MRDFGCQNPVGKRGKAEIVDYMGGEWPGLTNHCSSPTCIPTYPTYHGSP